MCEPPSTCVIICKYRHKVGKGRSAIHIPACTLYVVAGEVADGYVGEDEGTMECVFSFLLLWVSSG